MLTDKYSFIGCLHVLEQIFEAKTVQANNTGVTGTNVNNTDNTGTGSVNNGSGSNSGGNSTGVTPPPGVPVNTNGPAPPGVSPPAGTATTAPTAAPLSPGSSGSAGAKRNLFSGHSLDKDLTKMGLSFIKDNRLIYRFQSPFADMPCRVQDIDMFVPGEYLTNIHIREKLAEIKVPHTNTP